MGRAVTMDDLELLYQQDLKLLNSIEAGLNNKIQSFKEIIATIWIQRHFRGIVARRKVRRLKEEADARRK